MSPDKKINHQPYTHAAALLAQISKATQQSQRGKLNGWEKTELTEYAIEIRTRMERLGADLTEYGIVWNDNEPIRPDGKAE